MIAAGRRSAGPRRRAVVLAAAAFAAVGRGGAAGAAGQPPARASQWRLDVGRSRIAVTLARGDATVEGGFGAFDGTIRLDPARPEAASVTLTIDAGSFGTGDTDLDAAVRGPGYLDAARHPEIRYVLTGLMALGGGRYRVRGDLQVRGAVMPVTHFATIDLGTETVRAAGEVELVRTDWGIGRAPPADPPADPAPGGADPAADLGLDVRVAFELTADRVQG